MAYMNSHRLGNNLQEIEFFSKDIDYDKEFYETNFLGKDRPANNVSRNVGRPRKLPKYEDLIKEWELGGPVKVLPLPDFDVYPLYFTNFKKFDYFQLKELLGNFFTLCEFENHKVRVTYKTEDDLRVGYQALKKDKRYDLQITLDTKNYYNQKHGNNTGNNNFNQSNNKIGQRLVDRWISNGDVVVETSKTNCYPIQIKNYKQFDYDELMELFSKYGKFTSIAQLENEYVQVKFITEEAARKCIIDFKKDKNYNVRLLFFLKELNKDKKLVKGIVSSKSYAHINQLLNAEERIKFNPDQAPVEKPLPRVNRKNKKREELKPERAQVDSNAIYYRKSFEKGNIYVHGTPLENPFLSAPYSYKVWKNKQNHLPAPPPENSTDVNTDVNYEYYLKSMKALGYHSHTCCFDDD